MSDFVNFITTHPTKELFWGGKEVLKVTEGQTLVWEKIHEDCFYITNTSQNSGTFSVYSSDSNFPNYTNLEYSLDDGATWTQLNTVYDTVTVPSGGTIYVKGSGNGANFDNDEYTKINFSEEHEIGGNLATLVDYDTSESMVVPNNAYYRLFDDDTTLTTADISMTDFDNGGTDTYTRLFDGCTNLDDVTITAENWDTTHTTDWLKDVAPTGNLTVIGNNFSIPMNSTSGCPTGWTINHNWDYDNLYLTFEDTSNATNTVNVHNTCTASRTVEWSNDGVNWTSLTINPNVDEQMTIPANGYLFLRGNNAAMGEDHGRRCIFTASGSHIVYGNAMSLLDSTLTNIPDYAFPSLFHNNTTLTSSEHISFGNPTSVGLWGLATVFWNCSSMTTTLPYLPATTLSDYAYAGTFSGTPITTPPVFNAQTVGAFSFNGTFRDCANLATAPALSPTTLANGCYENMFRGCTSLTTAPVLLAETLVSDCYRNMFYDCSSLNYVETYAKNWDASNYSDSWLYGVAATGTFVRGNSPNIPKNSVSGIPSGWSVYSKKMLCFTAEQPNAEISLSGGNSKTVYISRDNQQTFSSWDGSYLTLQNAGDKVYMYGSNTTMNGATFVIHKKIAASGELTYLLDENGGDVNLSNSSWTFNHLFSDCVYLTSAPELPSTKIGDYCYYQMFRVCTSLTTAPELPVTTLAQYCYTAMFYGCTSLTIAPALPATTLAQFCYYNMFGGCTSLTTAPTLSATTLASGCYYGMFIGCTSLTTAPALPATALTSQCYSSMFNGCTSLTAAPALPATTLAVTCYFQMFDGCTSLTTAPALPATTLADYCYQYMFRGCTSLNSVTCLATDISATDCTLDWLYGVSATGTFTKATSMSSWTTGDSGIPNGWTVVNA